MKKTTILLIQTFFGLLYVAAPFLFMVGTWKTAGGVKPSFDVWMLGLDFFGLALFLFGAWMLVKTYQLDPVMLSDSGKAVLEDDVK